MKLHEEQVNRINCHLDLAVNQYPYNYPKFANMLSLVLHEVIDIYQNHKAEGKVDKLYEDWNKAAKDKCTKDLLGIFDRSEYTTEATLANSGMHAFAIAMKLAEDISKAHGLSPKLYAPENSGDKMYYETRNVLDLHEKSRDSANSSIFSYCEGTLCVVGEAKRLVQLKGENINEYIKANIASNLTLDTPKVLVVDATSSESRSLELDDESKELLTQGKLNIVIWRSHQKFGQAHADKMQCGEVTFLGKRNERVNEVLSIFQNNSQLDFKKSIDQQAIALMQRTKNQRKLLDDIINKHFDNGELLKGMLRDVYNAGSRDTILPISQHDRDYCILLDCDVEPEPPQFRYDYLSFMSDLIHSTEFRDSFGHFQTTRSKISNSCRVSLNASDKTDVKLEFRPLLMWNFYYGVSASVDTGGRIQEIRKTLVAALAEAPREVDVQPDADKTIELFCLCHCMARSDELSDLMLAKDTLDRYCFSLKGRNHYTVLMRNLRQKELSVKAGEAHLISDPRELEVLARKAHLIKDVDALAALALEARRIGDVDALAALAKEAGRIEDVDALAALAKEAGRIEDVDALAALAKQARRIKDVDALAALLNALKDKDVKVIGLHKNERGVWLGEGPAFNYIIQNLENVKFKNLVQYLSNNNPNLFQKIYNTLAEVDNDKFKNLVQYLSNNNPILFQKIYNTLADDDMRKRDMIHVVSSRVSEAYQNEIAYSWFGWFKSGKTEKIKAASTIESIQKEINKKRIISICNGKADGRSSKAARICLWKLIEDTRTTETELTT